MFYRQDLDLTLSGLQEITSSRTADRSRVAPTAIDFHLDAVDPSISFGEKEIPFSDNTRDRVAGMLGVPTSFAQRLSKEAPKEIQQGLYSSLFRTKFPATSSDLALTVDQTGQISDISEWGKTPIEPHRLVAAAANAMGTDQAPVVRLIDTEKTFAFDTAVPRDFDRGVGGDLQEGDVTTGGLRWNLDRKYGLTPSVSTFLYRLECTNGMESVTEDLKVDGRGNTVDDVIAQMEEMAKIAFGRVEAQIEHFYSLRSEAVDNPERVIRAIARERGLPNRSTMALLDLAAGEDMPEEPTMFDVVNLVTNLANSPSISRDGGRLVLERAGGGVVTEHASRCGHCAQKVH